MLTISATSDQIGQAIEAHRLFTLQALADEARRLGLPFDGRLAFEIGMSADHGVRYFANLADIELDTARSIARRNLH